MEVVLVAPECPHAPAARALLASCLDQVGLAVRARERIGDYPSPTILIDGIDVMTGLPGAPRMRACRLDVPTASRVLVALHDRATPPSDGLA